MCAGLLAAPFNRTFSQRIVLLGFSNGRQTYRVCLTSALGLSVGLEKLTPRGAWEVEHYDGHRGEKDNVVAVRSGQ